LTSVWRAAGIAVSDPGGMIAAPVGTIAERHMDVLLQKVAAAAAEQKAEAIVVGHPRNMDGTRGRERTAGGSVRRGPGRNDRAAGEPVG